jgi:FkbM family methyltransferase
MHLRATTSRAASLLTRNPSLFWRIALAKLNNARPMPPLPVRRRINKVLFECDLPGYRGTAPMYFGSYALLIVDAMKRFLKPGDVFIDVGANIGYLSAVAAGLVGTTGQVHAFEPVPEYFEKLDRLARTNPEYRIFVNACAAGSASGTSPIYVTHEPGQNTLVPSYKSNSEITRTLDVPVMRLDSYLRERNIGRVSLIKIDTEGFEFPVLKGLQSFFETSTHRPAIICEIAPRAYSLTGSTLADFAAYMRRCGYAACDLVDAKTPIDICETQHVEDVLFLPVAAR